MPVRVKNIHILQLHAGKGLVQAGKHVFAGSPVPVRAGPHQMPRLGCNNKFITETGQILHENTAKAFFRRTGRRAVIIRQVKIRDTGIKRAVNKPAGVLKIIRCAEIVPEPQGNGRKQQPAAPATAVGCVAVAAGIWKIVHREKGKLP